ncbi:MAG TPA: hypothetical protein VF920_06845 [Dongiaceae bacterium]
MRLIWLFGAMLLLAGCAATEAGRQSPSKPPPMPVDAGCYPAPMPLVNVDIAVSGPVEDRSLSYRTLSQYDSDGKGPAAKRGQITFGVTQSSITGHGDLKGRQLAMASGQSCVWFTAVTVKLTWAIRVDIASEISPGTCPDRAVREHEAKHVALDRRLQPQLKQKIDATLAAHGRISLLAASPATATQQMQEAMDHIISNAILEFVAERDRQQIGIDTPQEYERVMQLCGKRAFGSLVK